MKLAGNAGIGAVDNPGLGRPDQSSIYSLISSPSNPLALQGALLGFDAAGYEAFFRGTLQGRLSPRHLGSGAPFAVALVDAGLHSLTLNPLWVATTFVADVVWGFTYKAGGGIQASFTSHAVWDFTIFMLLPIR